MSWISYFDDFAQTIYRDSGLKNRIILWTFLLLVLPASLISAAGVPLKITSLAVAALILPLQIGAFVLSRRGGAVSYRHAETMENLLFARYTACTRTAHFVVTHP